MRIWHQSYTDLTRLPGYAGMMAKHASKVCDPTTQVDLHGIAPGSLPEGVPPVTSIGFRHARQLIDLQIIENAVIAEREGYDAVAISCFLDPGLEEARSLVDIPVVSSCEAALLMSSLVGRSFGLIALDRAMADHVRTLVARYGFHARVATVETLDPPMDEHQLDSAFADSTAFVSGFEIQARRLIAAGADVIIPAEGVLNTALVSNGVRQFDGVPVLDSYGTLLMLTETIVRLRKKTGLDVSRVGAYARPPAGMLSSLRGMAAQALLRKT